MEKSVRELYQKWFDITYPPVGQIRAGYNEKRLEEGISGRNLADAVLTVGKNDYLIIHEEDLWNHQEEFTKYARDYGPIVLDSVEKWKRFGDELNLNTTKVTIKHSKKYSFIPERRMGKVRENGKVIALRGYQDLKWDPEKSYRGVGWWGPKTSQHHIVTFDALVEGQLFADACDDLMDIKGKADFKAIVCSPITGNKHEVGFKNTPTSVRGLWLYTEWQDIKGGCPCDDSFFREAARRKQRPEWWEKFNKYFGGEIVGCRYWVGAYKKQMRLSRKEGDPVKGTVLLVDLFPTPREVMVMSYLTLKNRSLLQTDKGVTKTTKGAINAALGKILGYLGGFSEGFIFREEPYSDEVIRKLRKG